MDIGELKKLIKNSTSVLVLDNGEPSFVLLGYDAYKNLVEKGGEKEVKISQPASAPLVPARPNNDREIEILDKLNREIMSLRNQIELEEKSMALTSEI
jgi:hypothetical protein